MKTPIEFFESHLQAEDKRENTVKQYGDFLRRFDRFLAERYELDLSSEHIQDISGWHLSAFLQEMQQREISTRNNYVVILKRFFGFLHSTSIIENDPSSILHCVKEKKTPQSIERKAGKRYSKEDIHALLTLLTAGMPRNTDLRDAAIIALILGSGLRAFEVCALNVRQLDEIRSGVLFCLRKGGNWTHVSIADYVPTYIDRYLATRGVLSPDDPLFASQKGGRMERRALWRSLATKQSMLNLKTGIHIFRHTVLTAVDQNGGSALARDVGGHTSVQITNAYMHPSMEERQMALNSTVYAEELSSLVQS